MTEQIESRSPLRPREVRAWIEAGLPKAEFLERIDAMREDALGRLVAAYGDEYYAKLLYLKATNFLIARYHLQSGHAQLASRPITLMVDPANSCQLQCPGCVHSDNDAFTSGVIWPSGVMKLSAFEKLMRAYGPFATSTLLYNYGEPLLNKKLPEIVSCAREYGLAANLSTNLSLRFDVEAFVRAQPDNVILSIDGISQESYERFRKRGHLDLALENVRKIVEVKRRLGSKRPILKWRFLAFEHNVHEVDDALALAEEIGVDQMIIGDPFDVSMDDPNVRVTTCDKTGLYTFGSESEWIRDPAHLRQGLADHAEVHALFDAGWRAQASEESLREPVRKPEGGCSWLHYNLTVDAVGRFLPCCIASGQRRDLVYGHLEHDDGSGFNSRRFELSRLAFAERGAYEARSRETEDGAPYCASCTQQPPMTYGPTAAVVDLTTLDFEQVLLEPSTPEWWSLARQRP